MKRARTLIAADVRWSVWERDDFRCHYCGSRRFLSLDHKVPLFTGGSDDQANLLTACLPCNRRKHARPYRIFIQPRLKLPKPIRPEPVPYIPMRIRNRVKERRAADGMTQTALSARTGLTRQTLIKIERDCGYNPKTPTVFALCRVFGCRIGDLFWSEPETVVV